MFRRGSTTTSEPARDQVTDSADGRGAAGKGKATPKRREAEAARRTSVIAQATSGRGGRGSRESIAARREALRRGDESALPARDRGPVRRYVRDYVDARRNLAGLFVPAALPLMAISLVGVPLLRFVGTLALYLFVLAMIVDSLLMARSIRKVVATRFPGESAKGLGFYAFSRAMMLRRSRMPAPRVSRGAKV